MYCKRMIALISMAALLSSGLFPDRLRADIVVAPDLDVEVFAYLSFVPWQIGCDASGNVFVGNSTVTTGRIAKINAVTRAVSYFGADIPDPDAVIVDKTGSVGAVGSILVGSGTNCTPNCIGRVTQITSSGTSTTTLLSGGCLGNVSYFAFNSVEELFIANYGEQTVCKIVGSEISTFVPATGSPIEGIAIDSLNRVYVTWGEMTRQYDPAGNLLDSNFVNGRAVAFSKGPVVSGLVVRRSGSLHEVNITSKQEKLLISGISTQSVAFDAAGSMYIADVFGNDKVLRVFARPQYPLPNMAPCFGVELYATINSGRPGTVAFDDADNLYVGNFNVIYTSSDDDAIHIHKVDPISRSVVAIGDTISDPDAVVVDRNGDLVAAGSVLVGGMTWNCPSCQPAIWSITAGGSSTSPLLTSSCFENIQDLDFDSQGRVYFSNYLVGTICRWSSGTVTQFIAPVGDTLGDVTIGPDDNVYISVRDSVRRYDDSGALIDSFVTYGIPEAFGPPGPFAGLIVRRPSSLVIVDPDDGSESLIGVLGGHIAFNSTGDLFLSQINQRRVLRVYHADSLCTPCGDADGSSIISISDAVFLINYIFAGGPPPDPIAAGDVDCNGIITISDAVYMINYIFAGGAAPCAACP